MFCCASLMNQRWLTQGGTLPTHFLISIASLLSCLKKSKDLYDWTASLRYSPRLNTAWGQNRGKDIQGPCFFFLSVAFTKPVRPVLSSICTKTWKYKKKLTWSVDKNIPLLLQTKPLDQIPFSLNVAQRFSNSTKFYSSSEVSTWIWFMFVPFPLTDQR